MERLKGKSVYKGIALGKISVLKKDDYVVKRVKMENSEAEIERVAQAREKAKEQLQKLYDKAVKEVGEASAAIFEVHQMMLDDDDYNESIENIIRTQEVNAEYAVATTGDNFIVADDLSPSETVQMDKEKILAFVTVHGSTNSHTAILARMMNIPALIGVDMDLEKLKSGMEAVVDGFAAEVIFNPDEEVRMDARKRIQEEEEKSRLLLELKGKENITQSGHKINIYANIGSVGDMGYVLENDAGGIGLFRSEFLYIGRNELPSEE